MTELKKRRSIGGKHVVQFLIYHQSRANWLRKQKKFKDAEQHEADFQKAFEDATPNERATFEFVAQQLGVPNFPNVKGYEPYPLPMGSLKGNSRWLKVGVQRVGMSIQLPDWFAETLKEKTKTLSVWQRADLIRDAIAKDFGIPIPKDGGGLEAKRK